MAINPLNSSQSHDRTGQEGFSPLPSLDFRSILTQLGIWGFRATALGFPRETTVGVMGESSPKGQWRGSAGKGQEGPIGKGQFLVEKEVSHGFVSPHPQDSLSIPLAEHAWGSPRAFLKVSAA